MILTRTGIRWLVFRLHTYLNPLSYFRYHTTKNINFFEFGHRGGGWVAIPAEIPFFVRPKGNSGPQIPPETLKSRQFRLLQTYECKNCAGLETATERRVQQGVLPGPDGVCTQGIRNVHGLPPWSGDFQRLRSLRF